MVKALDNYCHNGKGKEGATRKRKENKKQTTTNIRNKEQHCITFTASNGTNCIESQSRFSTYLHHVSYSKLNLNMYLLFSIVFSVDGGLSDWSEWGSCSTMCGLGTQIRTRNCSNPEPSNGGLDCAGDTSESQSCDEGPCPGRSKSQNKQLSRINRLKPLLSPSIPR